MFTVQWCKLLYLHQDTCTHNTYVKEMNVQCPYPMLLYGDIGEVYKHVIQFTQTGCVLDSAKPTETKSIPIRRKKGATYTLVCR